TQPALIAARLIGNATKQAQALVELLPYSSEPLREVMIEEALSAAKEISNGVPWIEVLLKLMPYLPEPLRYSTDETMLAVVRKGKSKASQEEVLIQLATAGYTQPALIAARLIASGEQRAQILLEILPYLSGPLEEVG